MTGESAVRSLFGGSTTNRTGAFPLREKARVMKHFISQNNQKYEIITQLFVKHDNKFLLAYNSITPWFYPISSLDNVAVAEFLASNISVDCL